jgi:NTP pyrophosphatase (non-canonical NTP hydrolase)
MDFSIYQSATANTAVYGQDVALVYTTLGLASEAGEVAGKVKKAIRDNAGVVDDERRTQIIDELGDVLWYAARVADAINIDLNEVARLNLEKLASRKQRGVISGDGDKR